LGWTRPIISSFRPGSSALVLDASYSYEYLETLRTSGIVDDVVFSHSLMGSHGASCVSYMRREGSIGQQLKLLYRFQRNSAQRQRPAITHRGLCTGGEAKFAIHDCLVYLYHAGCSERFFTARCTIVQSAVLRSHVVCPSVCSSVCL